MRTASSSSRTAASSTSCARPPSTASSAGCSRWEADAMLRIALHNVLHRKLRFALTAVAVALGVAFVGGTYMLTDTMHAAFTTFFTQADSKLDLVVQSPSRFSNG